MAYAGVLYTNVDLIFRQELIIYIDIELIYNYSVLYCTTFTITKWVHTQHHTFTGIRYSNVYGW